MAALALTSHAITRMAQRGIHPDDLDLILAIGTEVGDGILVRKKDVALVERQLKAFLKRLRRIEGKRLVVAEGYLVTAYHARDRQQSRLLKIN
ncbi:DUF4258 domain-containing protein [Qipengyuania sp. 6B39]|uniref:DUF4258 domain-containing protein n=1 Tax=Qipengyuania proteolytica TaxID=2867239 RepID=UPI001C8A7E31|nr:DUF4258 domain-containing protein [Qipengyuania proteolytica]MBX7497229.1 DUF4258 domain-containing protein [Qipengyuania proteolytica]